MSYELLPRALRDLRAHLYYVAADDPKAAVREGSRLFDELERFSQLPVDGARVQIRGVPFQVLRWFLHPFHVYYEHRPNGIVVFRLYHHARRPLERGRQ